LTKQQARLLACEHDHVILTMPHALHDVWLANVAEMSRWLLASGHETLVEWLGEAKDLGAKPGSIAARHTWTQTLLLHPHLHGLVRGGGLSEAGPWVAVRHGFRLPMRVVMVVFRGKVLAAIRQGLHQGQLEGPEGKRLQQVDKWLNKLGRIRWHVPIRERYADGQGVLVYLARYVRGGPIANRRLLAADGQPVVLAYAERATRPGGQAKAQTMRLPLEPFLGRGWGLYAPTQGTPLAMCRQQLGQGPVEVPRPWEWPSACAEWGEAHPECCAVCGQRLVCTTLMPRAGVPPPAAADWEHVACVRDRLWERRSPPARDWCARPRAAQAPCRAPVLHARPEACRSQG
jgi:hypothetical protein